MLTIQHYLFFIFILLAINHLSLFLFADDTVVARCMTTVNSKALTLRVGC